MANKFDINSKPLSKAKPCVTLLIRDDGSIEWFENCKAGQLLQIKSGDQKAYLNLDYKKLLNFNVKTIEKEIEETEKILKTIKEEKKKHDELVEKEKEKAEEELEKLRKLPLEKGLKKAKEEGNAYDKRINSLEGKFVKLLKNRLKNMGTSNRPIPGFVCYEKEFNALPYRVEHDSKAITGWMDDILKNKKDFQAQRTEAFGKTILWVLIGLAVLAFIFFRWGAPLLEKTAEAPKENVAVISAFFPFATRGGIKWLKEKRSFLLKRKKQK